MMVLKSGSYLCCLISEVTSEPSDETLADLNLVSESNQIYRNEILQIPMDTFTLTQTMQCWMEIDDCSVKEKPTSP